MECLFRDSSASGGLSINIMRVAVSFRKLDAIFGPFLFHSIPDYLPQYWETFSSPMEPDNTTHTKIPRASSHCLVFSLGVSILKTTTYRVLHKVIVHDTYLVK